MHATHWGLEKPPFPAGTAEPVFFAGLPQQEALARLRFLVHNGRRLGLMLGEAGWGKSLVLNLFAEEAERENWHVASLNLLGLSVREFQWQLAVALHAGPRMADDALRLGRRLDERLHVDWPHMPARSRQRHAGPTPGVRTPAIPNPNALKALPAGP